MGTSAIVSPMLQRWRFGYGKVVSVVAANCKCKSGAMLAPSLGARHACSKRQGVTSRLRLNLS